MSTMSKPQQIALEALKKMRAERGYNARFSADEIWAYANSDVPSTRRPAAITWLRRHGHIEQTGQMRHAATAARAGNMTPEYRFAPIPTAPPPGLDTLCPSFLGQCKGVIVLTETTILRLSASLLAKRFLILTGLSGSGKTKLAQAFARWITPSPAAATVGLATAAPSVNPCYTLVPVGADWTSNENILGYPNALDPKNYVTKPSLELILHAIQDPRTPHFLILDEMNLSHVERYFADLLSAIESEEPIPLHQDPGRLAATAQVPGGLGLPPNLFVIGTVNVDETTYMFSPKVLDRANVIEFRMAEADLRAFLANPQEPDLTNLDGNGASFGPAFLDATAEPLPQFKGLLRAAYDSEILVFFNVLQAYSAEFGYRVAHETARFIYFYMLLGNFRDDDTSWFLKAFDCVIVQKFLPKLHGSRAKLGPLLKAIWYLATHLRSYSATAEENAKTVSSAIQEAAAASASMETTALPALSQAEAAPYRLTADKVARMWRVLNENGFASFAE